MRVKLILQHYELEANRVLSITLKTI